MYFRCDPNAVNNKNIQISPKITSIPDGDASDWNAVAKEIFSSGPAASAIVAQIQERFNSSAVLDRLSAIATQAIQSLAASDPDLVRRLLRDVAAQPRRGTQHGPGKQPGRETQAGRGTQPGRGGA
jgi:hypothetical protein